MSTVAAVTAAGGGVAQSVIKALQGTEYRTVGIDPSQKAAGLYMADEGYLGVSLGDARFVDRLIEICQATGAKYIFSGFDAELPILARNTDLIRASGIIPIISSVAATGLSDNKLRLMRFLERCNMPYIPTAETVEEAQDMNLQAPYLVKPIAGCRSQGIAEFETLPEVGLHLQEHSGTSLIIQEYIEGEEYTCGTVSFDGDIKGVICMTRELRAGDTYKAQVDQNPEVLAFVTALIKKVKPFGPCNVQLRLRGGIPYVLEINARCSGTTAARTLAGFNEPKMILDHLEGKEVTHSVENGLEILRYWQELVVRPSDRERIHP